MIDGGFMGPVWRRAVQVANVSFGVILASHDALTNTVSLPSKAAVVPDYGILLATGTCSNRNGAKPTRNGFNSNISGTTVVLPSRQASNIPANIASA